MNKNIPIENLSDSKKLALHYMKTLVEVAQEMFLLLDSDLRVLAANPIFYQWFKVTPNEINNKLLYRLGNGQWNIPELKRLLEEILPNKKNVLAYEVDHSYKSIGRKTILINARQVDSVQLIILAMEDITDRKKYEERQVEYTKELEIRVTERTKELNDRIKELEMLNKTMVGRELKMIELKKTLRQARAVRGSE